jgi:butyrate kinase
MIKKGNQKASLIYEAMAYQVAKEIGSMAAVLKGRVDGIVFTGGLAHDQIFIKLITTRINWISKIMVYPGEREMLAMAQGAFRILRNIDKLKQY